MTTPTGCTCDDHEWRPFATGRVSCPYEPNGCREILPVPVEAYVDYEAGTIVVRVADMTDCHAHSWACRYNPDNRPDQQQQEAQHAG